MVKGNIVPVLKHQAMKVYVIVEVEFHTLKPWHWIEVSC